MHFSRIMVVASMLAGVAGRVLSQQYPLPEDMIASFASEKTWAEELWLPTQLSTDVVNARITFENDVASSKVTIAWFFEKTGASARTSTQTVDVSFRPTAVARRAGTTMKFYVVGWSDRTGRVIVESWTFGQYLLGSSTPPGGGPTISTMSQPTITRVVEWISDASAMAPVWDAACQAYGNALLLLVSGSPTKIWSLDLDSRVPTELYSATTYSALAGHRMISIGKHGTDGLIGMTERRRTWEHGQKYPGPDLYFVMRDTDLDGSFDILSAESTDDFSYMYPPPWDNKYEEP